MSPALTLLLGAVIIFLAVCCICATIQAAQVRERNNNNPNFYKQKLKEKTLKTVQSKRRQTARDIMLLREELKQAEARLLEESKYEQELQENYRQRLIEEQTPKITKRDTQLRNRRGRFGDSPNFSDADDQDFKLKEPITVEIDKEDHSRPRNPYKHPVERGEDIFSLMWRKLKEYRSPVKDHKSDEDFLLEETHEEDRINEDERSSKLDFLKINMRNITKSRSKYAADDLREETPPSPTELRHANPYKTPSPVDSPDSLFFTPRKKSPRPQSTNSTTLEKVTPSRFSPVFSPLAYLKDRLTIPDKSSYEFSRVAPDDEVNDKNFGGGKESPASFTIEIGDSPFQKKREEKIAEQRRFQPAERPLSRAPPSLKPLKKSLKYSREPEQSPLRPRQQGSQMSSEHRKSSFANLPILESPPGTPRGKKPALIEPHPLHSSHKKMPVRILASEPEDPFKRPQAMKAITPPREAAKKPKEDKFHERDGLDFITPPIRTPKLLKKAEESPALATSPELRAKPLILKTLATGRGDIKKRVPALSPQTLRSAKPSKPPRLLKSTRITESPVPAVTGLKSEPPVEVTIKSPAEFGIKPSERFDPLSMQIDPPPSNHLKTKRKLSKKRLSGAKSPNSLLKKRPGSSGRDRVKTTSRPGSRKKIGLANEEIDLLIEDRPSSPLIPDSSTLKIDGLISAALPIKIKSTSKKTRQKKLRGLIDEESLHEVKPKRQKLDAAKQSEKSGLEPKKKIRVGSATRRGKEKRGPKLSRMTSARRKRKPK